MKIHVLVTLVLILVTSTAICGQYSGGGSKSIELDNISILMTDNASVNGNLLIVDQITMDQIEVHLDRQSEDELSVSEMTILSLTNDFEMGKRLAIIRDNISGQYLIVEEQNE